MTNYYTESVEEGRITDLSDFAAICIPAFVREEGESSQFGSINYSARKLSELNPEYIELVGLSPEIAELKASEEFYKELDSWRETNEKNLIVSGRLHAMLEKAKVWVAPTQEHTHFKEFMVSTLEREISYLYAEPIPIKESGRGWLKRRLARLEQDIQYHLRKQKVVEEVQTANALWLKNLKDSLGIWGPLGKK